MAKTAKWLLALVLVVIIGAVVVVSVFAKGELFQGKFFKMPSKVKVASGKIICKDNDTEDDEYRQGEVKIVGLDEEYVQPDECNIQMTKEYSCNKEIFKKDGTLINEKYFEGNPDFKNLWLVNSQKPCKYGCHETKGQCKTENENAADIPIEANLEGELIVSLSANQPLGQNIAVGQEITMLNFDLNAIEEDIDLLQIKFKANGLNSIRALENAKLVTEQNDVLAAGIFPSIDGYFKFDLSDNPYEIQEGTSRTLSFQAEVSEHAVNNGSVAIFLEKNTDISANGASSGNLIHAQNEGFPIQGPLMATMAPPEMVARGELTITQSAAAAQNVTVPPGRREVTLTKIDLTAADTEDVEVDEITFRIRGLMNRNDLVNAKLYKDGNILLRLVPSIDRQNELKFRLENFEIQKGQTKELTLKADISPTAQPGDILVATLMSHEQISAEGAASGAAIHARGNFPIDGPHIAISGIAGGRLNVALNQNENNIPIGKHPLMNFQVSAENDDIEINTVEIHTQGIEQITGGELVEVSTGDVIAIAEPSNGTFKFEDFEFMVEEGEAKNLQFRATVLQSGFLGIALREITGISLTTAVIVNSNDLPLSTAVAVGNW